MRAIAGAILIAATVIAYQMGSYESLFLEVLAVGLGVLLIAIDAAPDIARWAGARLE